MKLEQKVRKIKSVIRSCKNLEQLNSCNYWVSILYLKGDEWGFEKDSLEREIRDMVYFIKNRKVENGVSLGEEPKGETKK